MEIVSDYGTRNIRFRSFDTIRLRYTIFQSSLIAKSVQWMKIIRR